MVAKGTNKRGNILNDTRLICNLCMRTQDTKLMYCAQRTNLHAIVKLDMPRQSAIITNDRGMTNQAIMTNMDVV